MKLQEFVDAFVISDGGHYHLEDADQWMTDLVYTAHCGMLPDNLRYKMIYELASAMLEETEWDYVIPREFVDVYNSDLIDWLGSHPYRVAYCDEAAESISETSSLMERIQAGQAAEYQEIFDILRDFFEGQDEDE